MSIRFIILFQSLRKIIVFIDFRDLNPITSKGEYVNQFNNK